MKDVTNTQAIEVILGALALVLTLATLYTLAFLSPEIIKDLYVS